MDPAVKLIQLRQGTRSLEDHIQDFLDIAHLAKVLGFALIDFFCQGLNNQLLEGLTANFWILPSS